MDDATLVQQAVGGDRDAFAAIYDRYAPRIHDFLRSLLRDADEAADALQDTFLVAGTRLHQLRDPEKLRPWLYAIARHRGLRSIERRSRHRPLDDVDVISADPDPGDVAADADDRGELAGLVAAAADGLGPRDRVLLDLHLRQGLDGQELGDAIGVSASHAYVLTSRLRDQVERSLGALLMARQGREDCPELTAVLAGWDGRFTPVWRKRIARHVDGCQVCSDRRRRLLSPAGLLGAAPAFALPAGLRSRVLDRLELCGYGGVPWPGDGGFPPPLAGARRRWPAAAGALVAAVVLLVGGIVAGGLLLDDDNDAPTDVATASPTTVPVPIPGTTTTPDVAPPEPPTSVDPATDPPVVVDPEPDPGPDPTTTTATTTTTTARDTTPPELTDPTAVPGTVRAVTPCVIGSPRSTSVSVRASDPSGIRSVELDVGGPAPARLTMAPAGAGLYQVVVGPVPGTPGVRTTTVVLTARATDAAGNVATATGSFVLACVAPPGP